MDLVQSERERRKALKVDRDILFARYLSQPTNTRLAVEIKAIDDEIAKSIEDSSPPRQRSRIPTTLKKIKMGSTTQDE